jgi:hypothetical protein
MLIEHPNAHHCNKSSPSAPNLGQFTDVHVFKTHLSNVRPKTIRRFLPLLTGSWLCASRRQVHRRLRGACKFSRWINMPVADKFQNEVVKIHRSQVLKMMSLSNADQSHLRRETAETNCKYEFYYSCSARACIAVVLYGLSFSNCVALLVLDLYSCIQWFSRCMFKPGSCVI